MSDHTQTRRLPARRLSSAVLTGALLASLGLSACGWSDPNQQAIEDARTALSRISVGGASAYPGEQPRIKAFREVLDKLKNVKESADPGQLSAASLLAARAQGGLGEVSAQESASSEARFLNDVAVARAVLDQWMGQNQVAENLKAYDPAPDLAAIDREIATRNHESDLAAIAQRDLEAKVAGLKSQARTIQEDARNIRTADMTTRAKFDTMTQTDKFNAMEASAEKLRQADQAEKAASLILADLGMEQPKVDEQKAVVERLRRQIELLQQNKAAIQKDHEERMSQAGNARAEADKAGQHLDQLLTSLFASRDEASKPGAEAVKLFSSAVGSAKKAKNGAAREGVPAAIATAGSFEQSRADVLATRARSLEAMARLMTAVAGARPPLPNAAAYKTKAEATTTEAAAVTKDSEEAYKAALSLFQGITGGSDEAKARVTVIMDALRKLSHEPAEAPKSDTPPAPAPAEEPAAANAKPAAGSKPADAPAAKPTTDKPAPPKPPAPKP